MPVNWIDTTHLSFNHLLLFEQVQISWFPGWLPEADLALALCANPVVEWYLRHKCPGINSWLDEVCRQVSLPAEAALDPETVYAAEQAVLRSINDLLVYVIDPAIYDAQPFLAWDSNELTSLVDFKNKIVLDIGSGTGRLALVAALEAKAVFPVEPVGNLRRYLKEKTRRLGLNSVYPVDGLITDIPFPDNFADVTLSGHTYGDQPEAELQELERATRPGGMIILCPGNTDKDNLQHTVLMAHGYQWSRFEEPGDGWRRKYWKEK
jgi:SAM-dependent methyltransferase